MTNLLVTIVSGFTGTGRTTVARRLAAAAAGPAVVLSPDDDLVKGLRRVQSGRVIVERPADTDPLGVVEAFAAAGTDSSAFPTHVQLTDLVTVVDADDFPRQWSSGDLLADLDLDDGEEPGRTVTELLTDQVELATLVVVNKSDLVTASDWAGSSSVRGSPSTRKGSGNSSTTGPTRGCYARTVTSGSPADRTRPCSGRRPAGPAASPRSATGGPPPRRTSGRTIQWNAWRSTCTGTCSAATDGSRSP